MTAAGAPELPELPELSERIAAAARTVDGVVDLHGGVFGEVATYLPGGRVAGVRISDDRVEVHVALDWDYPIRATADAVRAAVTPLAAPRPVYVTVEDVVRRLNTSPDTPPPEPNQVAAAAAPQDRDYRGAVRPGEENS